MKPRGRSSSSPTPGPPRWVKAFGIVVVVLVAVLIVMLLTGHGPGRHMHALSGDSAAPVSVSFERV